MPSGVTCGSFMKISIPYDANFLRFVSIFTEKLIGIGALKTSEGDTYFSIHFFI